MLAGRAIRRGRPISPWRFTSGRSRVDCLTGRAQSRRPLGPVLSFCDNVLWSTFVSLSHYASYLLAYCDMKTLYLRNVPDDVVERLERLAARDGASVGATAVRELAEATRRADNPALLGALPDVDLDTGTIIGHLSAGRAEG